MIWMTLVGMVVPPGVPTTSQSFPFLSTMAGVMLLKGRLPAAMALAGPPMAP